MKKTGWRVYHVPQAEVVHFQGKSAEQDKKRAKVEYDRSRSLFFRKHRGTLQWFILLAGRMLRLLVEFIYWTVICSFTFFTHKKWKKKLSLEAYLLEWYLKGCPQGMGLKPIQ
jgi:GT2 family glycosyltransferase